MPRCEMCGTETSMLKTAKVEGAKLDVCETCAELGTTIDDGKSKPTGSTKYSTDTTSTDSTQSNANTTSTTTKNETPTLDTGDSIVHDYGELIREARESSGMSRKDLAQELNEKASLIKRLERGKSLPSATVQKKLERKLDITISEENDTEWDNENNINSLTLGDVVKRE